jgi:hypothetical protein
MVMGWRWTSHGILSRNGPEKQTKTKVKTDRFERKTLGWGNGNTHP